MSDLLSTAVSSPFLIRLLINSVSLTMLTYFCYYRRSPNRDFLFGFTMFGTGVFVVTYMLSTATISMGFAFGLFALFSMLRYRTETISMRGMTYLFLVITVALLSAVSTMGHGELLLLNGFICGATMLADAGIVRPMLSEQTVLYEKIENIRPENRGALLGDLEQRTGLRIHKVDVEKIDFLRDTAVLTVYFETPKRGMPQRREIEEVVAETGPGGGC